MKMRTKLIAAAGAVAAMLLPSSDAGAAISGISGNFAGTAAMTASPALRVNCTPGAATATSSDRLRLTLDDNEALVADQGTVSNANRVKASWPGGSIWLYRAGRVYQTSKSTKFPCPAQDGAVPMTVTFQPYRGNRAVGDASSSEVAVSWTGARSVRPFAVLADTGQMDLDCAPGQKVKASNRLRLAPHNGPSVIGGIDASLKGDDVGRATRYVASWNGGSLTMTKLGRTVTVSGGAKFVCPNPNNPDSQRLVINVQAYRGRVKVGIPAKVVLGLYNSRAAGSERTTGAVVGSNGGTVGSTSDPVNSSNPVESAVTLPPGVNGAVVISESGSPIPVANYEMLGAGVYISAPQASAESPLKLEFKLHAPKADWNVATLGVFRNGTAVQNCAAGSTNATPDPCVKGRDRLDDNTVLITVLTSKASPWGFGKPTGSAS